MSLSNRLVQALLLACLAAASQVCVGKSHDQKWSDDPTPYIKVRELFFHEARPDPLRRKFEELFGEPFPESGFHQFEPFEPFADVKKFNDAFELRGVAGARTELRSEAGKKILSLRLPGSEDKALKVRVNEERILVSLTPKAEPGRYRVARSQDQVLPLPSGVDPASAEIGRQGDIITIVFAAR